MNQFCKALGGPLDYARDGQIAFRNNIRDSQDRLCTLCYLDGERKSTGNSAERSQILANREEFETGIGEFEGVGSP